MDDDFAWGQYDKLVDDYFNKRETIKTLGLEENLTMITNLTQAIQLTANSIRKIGTEVDGIKDSLDEIKGTVNKKDSQINKLIDNIGLKSKHTVRLTRFLKNKVSQLVNSRDVLKMKHSRCQNAKNKLFTYMGVNKWEDISVSEESKAHAFIDTLEHEDLYY